MIKVDELMFRAPRTNTLLLSTPHLHLAEGKFHALLGPNGAGKSTLLSCLCGDLPLNQGVIELAGRPLKTYSSFALAHQRAVLPQSSTLPFAINVNEIISFGRDIYRNSEYKCHDKQVISDALAWLDISHIAHKNYQQLSGGEQHRSQIARTLAQIIAAPEISLAGRVLFLDEPTNHLDIRHQYSLMALLHRLKARGLTIVCVLHDIALALNYADTLVLLDSGEMVGHFNADELVLSNALDQVYGVPLNAHWSATYHRYVVMPT